MTKGLTLQAAKELQQSGIKEMIYVSLKWVNGELFTYDHKSMNALLLHKDEITSLLKNYKILQKSVYISDVQPNPLLCTNISDVQSTPFLCTNFENMDFQSHILGSIAIFTVEL